MLGKMKKDFDELPSWARVLFTVGIICSIVKWFPIVELLEVFLYVVVIPLGFLTMVGLLSAETSNAFVATYTSVLTALRKQLKEATNKTPEGTAETPEGTAETPEGTAETPEETNKSQTEPNTSSAA